MNSNQLKLIPAAIAALSVALALSPAPARADKFANQFVEFEMPPQWQCNLEGAEWVCQSRNDAKKRDAIIVLAAKLKGDQDSLDQYLGYLKAAKTYTSVSGRAMKSEPRYAKTININGQPWVDALHLESEIPGFYTRYLATIKQDIGVLVTYSINKNKYQEYQNDFQNMVNTLKVFRTPGPINVAQGGNGLPNISVPNVVEPGSVFQPGLATAPNAGEGARPVQKGSGLALILIVGGVVGFILWRRRKNAGGGGGGTGGMPGGFGS